MEAQMKTFHAILLATAMVAASTAAARAENVVLINLFEVPAGGEDAAVRLWDAARDFLARQPGYVSARLHRSVAPDARYPPRQCGGVVEHRSVPGRDRTDAARARAGNA
jgi:hypothetical protein